MKSIFTRFLRIISDKRFVVTGAVLLLGIMGAGELIACTSATDATADFSVDKAAPVVGEVVTVTDQSADAKNHRWNFGADAAPATSNEVGPHNVRYSTAGLKTITLNVDASDGRGNSAEAKKSIPVYGTYYYKGSGNPSATSNWNSARDGNGDYTPANFNSGYQTFIIQTGQTCNTSELWALTGPETKIILEAGATLVANHAIGNASSDIS